MRRRQIILLLIISLLVLTTLPGCRPANLGSALLINVTLTADGQQSTLKVPPGSSVQTALTSANITLSNLDRVEPATYTLLSDGASIQVVRVKETFEIEDVVLPYERQTVPNESLPEGQQMLVQAGANGLQQITYRLVYEDGVEISRNVFKVTAINQAIPEIEMIGVQRPFTSTPISGKIAYLTAGNAWLMDGATGNRRPIVTTADLDGRIFSISPDGNWLMFTRKPQPEETEIINSLWVVSLNPEETPEAIDLQVSNIIHYAEWNPNSSQSIYYSTVEPRSTAPGWQANNDLMRLRFSASGSVRSEVVIEANVGGVYGWWGIQYAFSPDGSFLAYTRPDSIGLVNLEDGSTSTLVDIIPLQTRGDWAWVSGLGWSPDEKSVFFTNHMPLSGLSNNEASPLFNVSAISPGGAPLSLVPQVGMFAYPAPSPETAESRYRVAYLQAYFPEQSENSRYRLMIMDRDGSNRQTLFPAEGLAGLDPQQVVWSPEALSKSPLWIALVYQGNLWLIDPKTSEARQVTGDGLITHIDWK